MKKTTNAFDNALAIISIFGFTLIFLKSFFGLDLSEWQTSVLLMVAGIGLLYEGKITSIKEWTSDGIQGNEFAYLFTITFGLFSFIAGILAIPFINIITPQMYGIIGFVSLSSIVFIIAQKWFI